MIVAMVGAVSFAVLVVAFGLLLGPSQYLPAAIAYGLFLVALLIGQLVNVVATRFGPEVAVAGDAARILLRLVILLMAGFTLENLGIFPSRSLQLWGWLLAAIIASLVVEIAVLLKITK